jgi:hypothetical protein
MRIRTRALIEAYYATDLAPLQRLHREHGVTHLIVESKHFEKRPATYFQPFNLWAKKAFDAGSETNKKFEVLKQKPLLQVYDDSKNFVLDLSKLKT